MAAGIFAVGLPGGATMSVAHLVGTGETTEQRGTPVSEPDGFRDFVAARSRALERTAWLLTGDWHAAEDLVQTALAKAWPRWSSIVRQDAPELYVRRIMVTTHASWWRRRWRGEVATGTVAEDGAVMDIAAEADTRHAVREALATLPPRQRAAVVLRYFDDFTEAQTAEVLGCSVGTVKSQVSKALAKLRVSPLFQFEEVPW
jgi:RNA polymerase sigma-70 factor (sigma-E family)